MNYSSTYSRWLVGSPSQVNCYSVCDRWRLESRNHIFYSSTYSRWLVGSPSHVNYYIVFATVGVWHHGTTSTTVVLVAVGL